MFKDLIDFAEGVTKPFTAPLGALGRASKEVCEEVFGEDKTKPKPRQRQCTEPCRCKEKEG